ncbi:nuclear pore complex subunit Nro1-domain-containing protein [Protomyces lactucae-debilis]|uniref:Nuclear pore complex subunit Nro1-domain-containing protein n=1 Tax=Protomyces lactucae-debilis TaxID=2754530 RepID=A0A1Y2FF31_PROLT|nr:nuclear pore complex subunit Nro1-domain-containing protein [Protomyces lactucae-debilis]ORY81435.1 nuclear pore complex subunit Nro1-domain-containing protein [Protomyces lactucae-debilis]
MADERKRPAGLAAAKRAKKPKLPTTETTTTTLDASEATVGLPADLAEDDHIGECIALYKTAVLAGSNRGPSLLGVSAASWLPLVRGTIHEADRLLRNEDAAKLVYTKAFFMAYASALLDLSDTVDDLSAKEGETSQDYVRAAQGLVERGLEVEQGEDDELKVLQARIQAMQVYERARILNTDANTSQEPREIIGRVAQILLDKEASVKFDVAKYEETAIPDILTRLCKALSSELLFLLETNDDLGNQNHARAEGQLANECIDKIQKVYEDALIARPDNLDAAFGVATCNELRQYCKDLLAETVDDEADRQFWQAQLETLQKLQQSATETIKNSESVVDQISQAIDVASDMLNSDE